MRQSWVRAASVTAFGSRPGTTTLSLMEEATTAALNDGGLERGEIDAVISGYSTTMPHIMPGNVFAAHAGLKPSYCHAVQVGGATGLAMIALASELVKAGRARNVLVVAGENRLTGQSRDASIQALAQIGHPTYEVSLGMTVPAYYALLASAYFDAYRVSPEDAAEVAVLMRRHAAGHPGAHLRNTISAEDVLASKPVALPLRLLDCCPISDGGAAVVISNEPNANAAIRIRGTGQAHQHQYLTSLSAIDDVGAAAALHRAEADEKVSARDVQYAGIYDSFTATLMILLEELGLARRGQTGAMIRDGHFGRSGPCPLNLHGGLLSYGHCGVAGGMAHFVEAYLQMSGRAGARQAKTPSLALVHADGGVMSAHVSVFLEGV